MSDLDRLDRYFKEKERRKLDSVIRNSKEGLPTMSHEEIRLSCLENNGYETPELNDKLYLHFRGFKKIENLDAYTGCKAIWLDSNGFSKIENLQALTGLRCLYLSKNLLSSIEGLESLQELVQLDLSNNRLTHLSNLSCCPHLESINLSRNALASVESVAHLRECLELRSVDLTQNSLPADEAFFDLFAQVPALNTLALNGNEITKLPSFRKRLIFAMPRLGYLDRPVDEAERLGAEAFCTGGAEAELLARDAWREKQQQKRRDEMAVFRAWQQEQSVLRAAAKAEGRSLIREQTPEEIEARRADAARAAADERRMLDVGIDKMAAQYWKMGGDVSIEEATRLAILEKEEQESSTRIQIIEEDDEEEASTAAAECKNTSPMSNGAYESKSFEAEPLETSLPPPPPPSSSMGGGGGGGSSFGGAGGGDRPSEGAAIGGAGRGGGGGGRLSTGETRGDDEDEDEDEEEEFERSRRNAREAGERAAMHRKAQTDPAASSSSSPSPLLPPSPPPLAAATVASAPVLSAEELLAKEEAKRARDEEMIRQQRVAESMEIYKRQQALAKAKGSSSGATTLPVSGAYGTSTAVTSPKSSSSTASSSTWDSACDATTASVGGGGGATPTTLYWTEEMDLALAKEVRAAAFDFQVIAASLSAKATQGIFGKTMERLSHLITTESVRVRWCDLDAENWSQVAPQHASLETNFTSYITPAMLASTSGHGAQPNFSQLASMAAGSMPTYLTPPSSFPSVADLDDEDEDEEKEVEIFRPPPCVLAGLDVDLEGLD